MSTFPFVSHTDLGRYLRRDLSADELAVIACDAACDMVRSATGQNLNYVGHDILTLNGTTTDALLLPEGPVVQVHEVLEDEEEIDGWTLNGGGVLYAPSGTRWCRGRQTVQVEYSHGYLVEEDVVEEGDVEPPEMPRDLRMLALTLAARIYDQGLVRQESVGGYQAIYASEESLGFSRRERDIVAKYRRPS